MHLFQKMAASISSSLILIFLTDALKHGIRLYAAYDSPMAEVAATVSPMAVCNKDKKGKKGQVELDGTHIKLLAGDSPDSPECITFSDNEALKLQVPYGPLGYWSTGYFYFSDDLGVHRISGIPEVSTGTTVSVTGVLETWTKDQWTKIVKRDFDKKVSYRVFNPTQSAGKPDPECIQDEALPYDPLLKQEPVRRKHVRPAKVNFCEVFTTCEALEAKFGSGAQGYFYFSNSASKHRILTNPEKSERSVEGACSFEGMLQTWVGDRWRVDFKKTLDSSVVFKSKSGEPSTVTESNRSISFLMNRLADSNEVRRLLLPRKIKHKKLISATGKYIANGFYNSADAVKKSKEKRVAERERKGEESEMTSNPLLQGVTF